MFGFGNLFNRNTSRTSTPGIFGGGFRRAAMMGLGMMALRWWRNRQAGGPAGTRRPSGAGWR